MEGQTWWLALAVGAVFAAWAILARRPLLTTCAAAFGLAAALMGVWALWQGGLPEFSDAGFI